MANETCSYECKPHIGADGFWYVGSEFTNVRAVGTDGITPNIGADGYWYIWDKNMGVKAVGEPGAKGEKGDKGDFGAPGPQGIQGVQGPQGVEGPQGRTGATGQQGTQGLQGAKGDKGDAGVKGDIGPAGPVNIANNLTTEAEGYALDARQGKELKAITDNLNKDIKSGHEYMYFKLLTGDSYITVASGQKMPFILTDNKCSGISYENGLITINDETIKLIRLHANIGGSSDGKQVWTRICLNGKDYATSINEGTYVNSPISCIIPVKKGDEIYCYPNAKIYAGSGGLMNYMYIERII